MKYTLIILFILVVLAYVFKDKLGLDKPKPAEQKPDEKPKNPIQPQGTKFPLKKGSVSPLVGELQKALKINVDNVWGNQTEETLKRANLPNSFASEQDLKGALAGISIVKNIFKTS